MKTLVWFYIAFATAQPHMRVGEPLLLHFDMPAAECEEAVRKYPPWIGPIGHLPGYSGIFMTWCEDRWPETMDEERK